MIVHWLIGIGVKGASLLETVFIFSSCVGNLEVETIQISVDLAGEEATQTKINRCFFGR